jgi:hypothetical protein
MSAPGRPHGESPRPQAEGAPVNSELPIDISLPPAAGPGLEEWPAGLPQQLLGQLQPPAGLPPPANGPQGLRQRLLQRARRSVAEHAGFITVRHGDTPWTAWTDGRRTRELRGNGGVRIFMLELLPGAAVPALAAAHAQDVLVVQGLLVAVPAHGPALQLPAQSYAVRTAADAHAVWVAPQGALLYVRDLTGPRSALAPAEAQWWPPEGAAAQFFPASDEGWLPFAAGVQVKPLVGSDAAVSMLARFEPGASVLAHGHGLDEDCLMLRGDLYLGDVLLREGEYQMAPGGSRHNGLMSDTGGVLFFHGAVDTSTRTE